MLAAAKGQSRSAMINHVLAEFASLSTPEARRRQVIETVEQMVNREVLRTSVSSGGILTLSTILRYKYNPNLRYVVELYHESPYLGELRVGLRSQNSALLSYMEAFFELWNRLESHHAKVPPAPGISSVEGARYRRILRRPAGEWTQEDAGEAIAAYISRMDGCVKAFFANLQDAQSAVHATEEQYLRKLQDFGKIGRAGEL